MEQLAHAKLSTKLPRAACVFSNVLGDPYATTSIFPRYEREVETHRLLSDGRDRGPAGLSRP
jgi:hypothetical protein